MSPPPPPPAGGTEQEEEDDEPDTAGEEEDGEEEEEEEAEDDGDDDDSGGEEDENKPGTVAGALMAGAKRAKNVPKKLPPAKKKVKVSSQSSHGAGRMASLQFHALRRL